MFGLFFLIFGGNPDVEFKTPLSLDECKEHLIQELHRRRKAFGIHAPPPCVELVEGDRFVVSRNQSFFYRDNFVVLDGRLKTVQDGTLVRATFHFYYPLSAILIAGFALFFGMATNDVLSNHAPGYVFFIPIVFWGLLGLFYWLLWRRNKSKNDALAAYAQSILRPPSSVGQ